MARWTKERAAHVCYSAISPFFTQSHSFGTHWHSTSSFYRTFNSFLYKLFSMFGPFWSASWSQDLLASWWGFPAALSIHEWISTQPVASTDQSAGPARGPCLYQIINPQVQTCSDDIVCDPPGIMLLVCMKKERVSTVNFSAAGLQRHT